MLKNLKTFANNTKLKRHHIDRNNSNNLTSLALTTKVPGLFMWYLPRLKRKTLQMLNIIYNIIINQFILRQKRNLLLYYLILV